LFKGAAKLLAEGRVGLIYFELIFCYIEQNLPEFPDVFGFLALSRYLLITFNSPNFQRDLICWKDVLFIHRDFYELHAGSF